MSIEIRAEEIIVEIAFNGKVRNLPLTTILKLLMAEVLDNSTFQKNLQKAIETPEATCL